MSPRSGETARRAALGIGQGRNGGQVAQALQTIRYSVLDKRRGDLAQTRSQLQTKRKDKAHLMWALRHEAARLETDRAKIVERLDKIGKPERVDVSDHALVRFLERVMGMDLTAVRAQISRLIPVQVLETDRALYIRDGYQFLVSKEHLIVTILDAHMDPGIEEAFEIDGATIAPLKPGEASANAASVAARTLSRRAHSHRAKFAQTTAQLAAEIGWKR